MKRKGTVKTTIVRTSHSAAASKAESKTPGIMEEVEPLLRLLEEQTSDEEESHKILQKLQNAYKTISIANKVDSKREELLQQEIVDLQRKNFESTEEIKQLQEQYRAAEVKVEKLENLSKVLSGRVKSVESKASDDVKFEKEDRLRLSYEFSAKIKDISVKLDFLGKRREVIINENARLKQVLKACFDDFNSDPDLEHVNDATDEADSKNGMVLEDVTVDAGADLDSEARASVDELKLMEQEDDFTRIQMLREQEDTLKIQSAKFMEVFDSFQQRLTESNQLFRMKQNRVEETTKEIKSTEKSNNELAGRVVECTMSSKSMAEAVEKQKAEKDRLTKLIEKQRALIDKFQADINILESVR